MLKSLCFSKKILAEIEKCYACLGKTVNGEPCLFFAGEGDGSVHAFLGESFERHETIWQGGGGTMGIVAIPGHDEWTLVSRGFYSMVDCGESTIEIVRYAGGRFTHEPIASLPYLHRFGALKAQDGTLYLVAASLHSGKADKADWSKPGHLYWAQLPDNMEKPFHVDFQPFEGEYYQNHGFCTACVGGIGAAYTSSREACLQSSPGKPWRRLDGDAADGFPRQRHRRYRPGRGRQGGNRRALAVSRQSLSGLQRPRRGI